MEKTNIGKVINGYEIKKELKGGGMSQVYLAQNIDNNSNFKKDVIIKIISKNIASSNGGKETINTQWNKAIDEFKLTWQIFQKPHENIAKPISWKMDENDNEVIIITEFVDGPSLSAYIAKQKALKTDRAMYYFKNICEGVKHLHQINENRTIIHRDLKSDNIMLSKDLTQIKIIDYGIATSFYDNIFESDEGTIYCTANYTTPDILKLNSNIVKAAMGGDLKARKEMSGIISVQFDFHALGIILYEMLTGDFPFKESPKDNDRTKIGKWLKYDLPVLSIKNVNIPNSIDNIIFRLTASKPDDLKYRYNNIDEVLKDIEMWNDPGVKNSPLIKPIEKRTFEQPVSFNIDALKDNEKFYNKWWFFIVINLGMWLIIILAIIIIVLAAIGII